LTSDKAAVAAATRQTCKLPILSFPLDWIVLTLKNLRGTQVMKKISTRFRILSKIYRYYIFHIN